MHRRLRDPSLAAFRAALGASIVLAALAWASGGLAAEPGLPDRDAKDGDRPSGEDGSAWTEEGDDGDGIESLVFLSSGERLRGKLSLAEGQALRIYDIRTRRTHSLALEKVETIRTLVEKEGMEEAWAFEEGGSRKKVRLGWTYPFRHCRQEIQLRGGQVIEGHCHALPLYLRTGTRELRLILPRSQKGKSGETLGDLVYPASIDLGPFGTGTSGTPGKPNRPLAALEGARPGLSAVAVLERETGRSHRGTVAADGAFRVDGVLPGEYAVFLRRGGEVTVGLGAEPELDPDDRKAIRSRIESLAEFYDEKRILAMEGPARKPWILLELERKRETTLSPEAGGSYRFLRWELWVLEKRGAEWAVASRAFLDRRIAAADEEIPPTAFRREPRHASLRLAEGKNALP